MANFETPTLPLSTMIIKLSSTNYLLWHAQIEPLLTSQNFVSLFDGSSPPPPTEITAVAGTKTPNPKYTKWYVYSVNTVSQFPQRLTTEHFHAVKHILRYVKGTLGFGLSFSPGSPNILGYSDADWARCIDTRRSTYGYYIFLGPNLISWSAKKQPTVARSSCESEYKAIANTASELLWVCNLLKELSALPKTPHVLLSDNKSALFFTQNPISHKRAKHIDIGYHFVRELVESGRLSTRFVPSSLQLADIFTKSLPHPLFEMFRSKLRISLNPTLRLREVGGISDIVSD